MTNRRTEITGKVQGEISSAWHHLNLNHRQMIPEGKGSDLAIGDAHLSEKGGSKQWLFQPVSDEPVRPAENVRLDLGNSIFHPASKMGLNCGRKPSLSVYLHPLSGHFGSILTGAIIHLWIFFVFPFPKLSPTVPQTKCLCASKYFSVWKQTEQIC